MATSSGLGEPFVSTDDGVGQSLNSLGILFDERNRCVEAAGRHRAAEEAFGFFNFTGVGNELGVTVLQKNRDNRIKVN